MLCLIAAMDGVLCAMSALVPPSVPVLPWLPLAAVWAASQHCAEVSAEWPTEGAGAETSGAIQAGVAEVREGDLLSCGRLDWLGFVGVVLAEPWLLSLWAGRCYETRAMGCLRYGACIAAVVCMHRSSSNSELVHAPATIGSTQPMETAVLEDGSCTRPVPMLWL